MAARPSDSSRNQAGLEVIARALPFETIPDEPLRAHFARWLLGSLTTADRLGPFPSPEPETPPPAIDPEPAAPQSEREADNRPPEPVPSSGRHPQLRAQEVEADPPDLAATASVQADPAPEPPSITAVSKTAPETPPRVLANAEPEAGPPLSGVLADASTEALLEKPPPHDPPGFQPLPLAWQGSPEPPRPQFVRQRDGMVWVTKPILRTRGWTDSAVRKFLPQPEGLKPNPRFATTSPMPVWRPATIAAAESTPQWQDWLERSLRRRQTTLEALAETEDQDFRARVETARAAIEGEGGKKKEGGTASRND